jgi:hypothetical protein
VSPFSTRMQGPDPHCGREDKKLTSVTSTSSYASSVLWTLYRLSSQLALGWTSPMRAGELERGHRAPASVEGPLAAQNGGGFQVTAMRIAATNQRPSVLGVTVLCAAPGAAAAPGPRGCVETCRLRRPAPRAMATPPAGPSCAPTMRQPRPLPGSMSAALCSLPTTHFRLCPYAARLQRKERPATAPFSPLTHAAKSSRRRVRVPSRASIRLIYALI